MKRSVYILVVLLFLCMLAVWNRPSGDVSTDDGKKPNLASDADRSQPANRTNFNASRGAKIRESTARINAPIKLYGLVVDQDGKPVPGATVKLAVTSHSFLETMIQIKSSKDVLERVTDADGRFALLDVAGEFVSIEDVVKEGYWLPHRQNTYAFAGSPKLHQSDANSPVTLTIIAEDDPIKVVENDYEIRCAWNGDTIRIDLETGKISPAGELMLLLRRKRSDSGDFDWCLDCSSPEGGVFIGTIGEAAVAPITGYANIISFGRGYSDRKNFVEFDEPVRVYIRTAAGKHYALLLTPYPWGEAEGDQSVVVHVSYNIDGTRVMEKRKKN
jgi:hypothetical protein